MRLIDLRSDTVTKPTEAMRRELAAADVGDDVYGEDPTVNALQQRAAELTGKEAALFFPSGTMANQAAIRSLTRHGDLVLAGEGAHILRYESGAAAALSGVQIQTLGNGGLFDASDVEAVMMPHDHHLAPATLVAVENTHNSAGGRIFPREQIERIAKVVRQYGLRLHLDGARLFNAVVATGISAAEWAAPFDTVSFCLSKGLGAPAGSMLCGSTEVIDRAHRMRKMFGGGMRQVGILAAAGLHALEHHIERLAVDHDNARRLATGLDKLGFTVDPPPETNMVRIRCQDALATFAAFYEVGVLVGPSSANVVRAVTHLDVSAEDIDEALRRIGGTVSS